MVDAGDGQAGQVGADGARRHGRDVQRQAEGGEGGVGAQDGALVGGGLGLQACLVQGPVGQRVVEIIPTQLVVAAGGLHFEDPVAELQNGYVEHCTGR